MGKWFVEYSLFVLFFFYGGTLQIKVSVRTEENMRVLEITEAFTAVKSKVCRGGGDLVGLREIISVIFINAQ